MCLGIVWSKLCVQVCFNVNYGNLTVTTVTPVSSRLGFKKDFSFERTL